MSDCYETEFGFRMGSLEVTRLATLPDGSACIRLSTTGGQQIDVYSSPAGRSLRVFKHGKGEMLAGDTDV